MTNPAKEAHLAEIKTLSERVWENRTDAPKIERWLDNFDGAILPKDVEQLHALHLLKNFNYFGVREIRVLLTSMYRDIFKYSIVQDIRDELNNTTDPDVVQVRYDEELNATRFLAMGNPSESGAHILYYFRQVNSLAQRLFASPHELADGPLTDSRSMLQPPGIKRIVFIDDLLGSGQQAALYSEDLLADLRSLAQRNGQSLKICYYVLFAKPDGLKKLRELDFDDVQAVHELDASQMAFEPNSRIYANPNDPYTLNDGLNIAFHYGQKIVPKHPLGYGNGQMLLGLSYNVPDNTLPIFWFDEAGSPWTPIFPRYPKVYS